MKFKKTLLFVCSIIGGITIVVVVIIFLLINRGIFQINSRQVAVVKQMKALNRLETASFSIEKIIDSKTSGNALQDFLFGDQILLIAHGEVIAGFDLSQISQDDVVVLGNHVTITLPPPKILVVRLDNSLTRVYDRKQGILTRGNKDLESEARSTAENSILQAACQNKILPAAAENARKQLSILFSSLGFSAVTIIIPESSC